MGMKKRGFMGGMKDNQKKEVLTVIDFSLKKKKS